MGLYLFAEPMVKIVFRSLEKWELETLVRLVKIFSVSALSLSCVQTLSACLTAQGKPQYAIFSTLIAMAVKTVLYIPWLKNPEISIYGLAFATNIAYFLAFAFDFFLNLYASRRKIAKNP